MFPFPVFVLYTIAQSALNHLSFALLYVNCVVRQPFKVIILL